jgi:hypothetical protein
MPNSLSEELIKKDYHPVVLIGTRAAGKTSLLTSLFRYLRTDSSSKILYGLGEAIIPEETPVGEMMYTNAKRFLNNIVIDFQEGKAAGRTSTEPYFIPVVLTPTNGQPPTKIAILEIPGEYYQIERSSIDMFKETSWEIADVYRNYHGPISIVIVGPIVVGDAYQSDESMAEQYIQQRFNTDIALNGALQTYQSMRSQKANDNISFLLTKWDAYTKGVFSNDFRHPPKGLIENLINQLYPNTWNTFNLLSQLNPDKLIAMRYCSGLMSGDHSLPIPKNYIDDINIYPKILWSWLYENSSGGMPLYPREKNKYKLILQKIKDIIF